MRRSGRVEHPSAAQRRTVARRPTRTVLMLATLAGFVACVPDGPRPTRSAGGGSLSRVLDAEDARPVEGPGLDALITAANGEEVGVRRVAVRALGRLEREGLSADIARHLSDPDAGVRAAAAEALAQSVHGADGTGVLAELIDRVDVEDAAVARAALARAIGRLGVQSAGDRRRAAEALARLAAGSTPDADVLVGVVLGFEALLRNVQEEGLERAAAERLEFLSTYGLDGDADSTVSGRIRALAVTSLGQVRRLGREAIERAQSDPDPDVRRAPLRYLDAVSPSVRPTILRRGLADLSPRVAIDAVRIVAAGPRTPEACSALQSAAASGVAAAVRIVALDALARPCPERGAQLTTLRAAVSEPAAADPDLWQPAARALVSLARLDASAARELLASFVIHVSPFARGYAAQVAGVVGDEAILERLAADRSPNVRGVALQALFDERGHSIDDLLLDQLASDDPQLLMTASGLLAGSSRRGPVAAALVRTFERLSEAQRETWRDPRAALLERVAELGDSSLADRLRPYLSDYDPVIATAVAEIVRAWTGEAVNAAPEPLPRAALPARAELAALERTSVVMRMRGGGEIVISLLPGLAPRNAWRFVSLAREGYFDGLTFHRWAANFVIQGGSPGANEYAGDGPYTRDEVGGSHWRGTVGVSTRGRDTGDGQIFVNLVHNVRLDHDYTVFGFVSEGMEVVDSVLEGAVIERVEVRAPDE